MNLAKIAGRVFVLALFGVIVVWGYLPKLWVLGWPQWSLMGLAAAALALWVIFSLDKIRLWMKRRSTQFGIGLAITAVMALAILGSVNWIATIYNKKIDVTVNKLHTLSEQSKKVLSGLKSDVTLRVWSTNVDRMSANIDMRKFLENYKIAAGGKLKLEIRNPNDERLEAEKDGVKRDNLLIVKSGEGREVRVDSFADTKGEEQITNAIIQATHGEAKKKMVCFLVGHGELSIDKTEPDGLSTIKQRMNDSSYQTKEIMMANADKMPPECEALVIVGPQTQASDNELKMLQGYLSGGGKVMALFGPGVPSTWKNLASSYGVEVRNDLIIDPRVQPLGVVFTKNYSQDVEITKSFGTPLALPEVSSLNVPTAGAKDGASVKTFVSSESYTYAKSGDPKSIRNFRPLGTDLKGPLPVAVLITKPVTAALASPPPAIPALAPKKEEKKPAVPTDHGSIMKHLVNEAYAQEDMPPGHPDIGDEHAPPAKDGPKDAKNEMSFVVIGNSSFAANAFVSQYGNLDFFLNNMNYLLKDQDLIGIRPREIRQASLELTRENLRQVYATILLIALAFLLGGIMAGNRKRASV